MTNWLTKVREAGTINRFHTRNLLHPQNIATHSFNTFFLVNELMKGVEDIDKHRVMIYSQIHDIAETATGDVVGSVKADNPELKKVLDNIEEKWIMENMPQYLQEYYFSITHKEKLIAKFADLIDCLWKSLEEVRYGNYNLKPAVKDAYQQVIDKMKELYYDTDRDLFNAVDEVLSVVEEEFGEELMKFYWKEEV